MTREEIKTILPHREDMLLLDDVCRDGEYAVGHYHVRGDEFFLRGHFPDHPIVPGVILCEILAQSACVLLSEQMSAGKIPMYTGLDRVRFRAPVHAGDIFETKCKIERAKPPFFFAKGEGSVNGKVCVTAEFSFAVTNGG